MASASARAVFERPPAGRRPARGIGDELSVRNTSSDNRRFARRVDDYRLVTIGKIALKLAPHRDHDRLELLDQPLVMSCSPIAPTASSG